MTGIGELTGQTPLASIAVGSGTSVEPGSSMRPRSLPEAAQQFESLLIAELLRSAHGDGSGWLGSGEDSTASPAIGIAEESLAQSIASHGGLGLSKYVVQSLSK